MKRIHLIVTAAALPHLAPEGVAGRQLRLVRAATPGAYRARTSRDRRLLRQVLGSRESAGLAELQRRCVAYRVVLSLES